MTTRDHTPTQRPPTDPGEWVNLRDERGNVQARYCPRLQLLVIRERRVDTVHELGRFRAGLDANSTPVLKSP
jgi:hypothetical protein